MGESIPTYFLFVSRSIVFAGMKMSFLLNKIFFPSGFGDRIGNAVRIYHYCYVGTVGMEVHKQVVISAFDIPKSFERFFGHKETPSITEISPNTHEWEFPNCK
jgi:hypothetical protein